MKNCGNVGGKGQYVGGRGLLCGWAGTVILKNCHFHVIKIFTFQTFLPTYLPRDTPSKSYSLLASEQKPDGGDQHFILHFIVEN